MKIIKIFFIINFFLLSACGFKPINKTYNYDFKIISTEFTGNRSINKNLIRKKNHKIPPHTHNKVKREVSLTQEVIFVKSGKVRVDYYDGDMNYLESKTLYQGDVVLLAGGGHGFQMLEDSEMIEVKQGPYSGDQDKKIFEPVDKDKLKIKS